MVFHIHIFNNITHTFYTFSLPSGKRPLFSVAKGSYEWARGCAFQIRNGVKEGVIGLSEAERSSPKIFHSYIIMELPADLEINPDKKK